MSRSVQPLPDRLGPVFDITWLAIIAAVALMISAAAEVGAAAPPHDPEQDSDSPSAAQPDESRTVKIRAVDAQGNALPEAIPMLERSRVRGKSEFDHLGNGVFESPELQDDRRWLRVVAAAPDQQSLWFSDLIDIADPAVRDGDGVVTATLKPGVRLQGRLADSVPRPVGEGYVELYINEGANHQIPDEGGWEWEDFAPIEPDGSFVFESLPHRAHAQLFALVDGYQSTRPTEESLREYLKNHQAGSPELVDRALERPSIWPHLFHLKGETVEAALPCTPTASVRVRVVDPGGYWIPGAQVDFNPNGYFLGGNLFIPGWGSSSAEPLLATRGDIRRQRSDWASESFLRPKTDTDGIAEVGNLPGRGRETFRVRADGFVMPPHPTSNPPGQHRYATVEYQPGQPLTRTVTLEHELPRTERELLIVDDQGNPLADITATVTELALLQQPDDWQFWSVQRFGSIISEATGEDGRLVMRVPTAIERHSVQSLRVQLKGRIERGAVGQRTPEDIDGYVNNSVVVPVRDDGRVVCLTVDDHPPRRSGAFRSVTVDYVAPETLTGTSRQKMVQQLAETPSLIVLRQLLAAAEFDEAMPLEFAAKRNSLQSLEKHRSPVTRLATDVGERLVVLCSVRPKDADWTVKPEMRSPPEAAFVFDTKNGSLVRMLGGTASGDRDYVNVTLTNLGGTDDYFVFTSAFEEHPPFRLITRWYRLGAESQPALEVWHYANSNAWSGKEGPSNPPAEFGYLEYEFNGQDLDAYAAGVTPDGLLVPRYLFWDGTRNTFLGPETQSFDGRPLYRVVTKESHEFQPLEPAADDIVVGGGRRDYQNWYSWRITVPRENPVTLRLLLAATGADQAAATADVLHEQTLEPGRLHHLQLQLADDPVSDRGSTVNLRIDRQEREQTTTRKTPAVSLGGEASAANRSVYFAGRPPLELLRQPLEDGRRLVWRIDPPE